MNEDFEDLAMWTVNTRQKWEKLPEKFQEEADRIVAQIAQDPMHKNTHQILGEPVVRHLITPSRLYIVYAVIGSIVVILDIEIFTTFLVE